MNILKLEVEHTAFDKRMHRGGLKPGKQLAHDLRHIRRRCARMYQLIAIENTDIATAEAACMSAYEIIMVTLTAIDVIVSLVLAITRGKK